MLDWKAVIPPSVRELKPSGIRKFFDIVGNMPGAISLGVGEPDFVTPYHIRQAAIRSIQRGETQYTANRGILELRERIAGYLGARFGLDYDPAREILVTVGGSEAIDLAIRAITSPGDEIVIPEPCFVSYAPLVTIAGGVPVACPTRAEDAFRLDAAAAEAVMSPRTKAILLSYPNNPTGATMPRARLEPLAALCRRRNLIAISDEIYAELSYDAPFVSIAALEGMRERTIVVSGFSKAFAMTGWRIGYLAAPAEAAGAMTKIHQFAVMCASTVSQRAALAALEQGEADGYASVAEMKEQYDRRRRFMYDAFCGMGLDCFEPQGAFYEFPSVRRLGMTGDEFAEKLLAAKGVAVVPGSAFGEYGRYHIRCCYAVGVNDLKIAFDRIAEFIGQIDEYR